MLREELQNAWKVIIFDQKAILDVAKRNTTKYAIGFLIVSSLLSALLLFSAPELLFSPISPLQRLVMAPVVFLVMTFVISSLFHGSALLWKGSGSIMGIFRFSGYVTWVSVMQTLLLYLGYVPLLELLARQLSPETFPFSIIDIAFMIYSLCFYTYAISIVENISRGKAVLVWLIPFIVFLLLLAIAEVVLLFTLPVV